MPLPARRSSARLRPSCRPGARPGSTPSWRFVAERAPRAAPVMRLMGVRKTYGAGTPVETEVLHGIDLTLRVGEFTALIGPSGSGKSTLLNVIGLLDRPS